MDTALSNALNHFFKQEGLPEGYMNLVHGHLIPLTAWIHERKQEKPLVIGINGAQGSGKSTMSVALAIILKHCFGHRVATLSIDDLYLRKEERNRLATTVHPLFKTRGVPGTHDIQLGVDTIVKLITESGDVAVPRFDKSTDDRWDETEWPCYRTPVDILFLEGWCVATPPQPQNQLLTTVNELEASEDREGVWRRFANEALASDYQRLFSKIDVLLFLKVPGFDAVMQWRGRQERQTFKAGEGMETQQLTRFIQHFERLTRHSLEKLPGLADVVIELDDQQQIIHRIHR
ncbi:hypothetical protein [Mariprofundus sp. KV]|uniref:hypothetical protein n=1 Tax=Mariprofundus sp. KV TaxID=2608715 RepID=UPI0015A133EE|nr:hypothetical protein [Mariprofundus sp. KV]NWF35494.1 hypothetical protein [Mariprofundus sp. KV]